jgi:hypothetical protein
MKLGAGRARFIDEGNGLNDQTIGVPFPAEEESFFSRASRWLWGHSPSYPLGTGGCFSMSKAPRHEADHSPPPGAEFKNAQNYAFFPTCLHGMLLN